MGMPKLQAIRTLLAGAPTGAPQTIDALATEVHAAFKEFLLWRYRHDSTVRPVPEAANVFKQLRDAGIRIALDTGFSREVLDVLLTRFKWTRGVVDVTVASDEVEKGRPHPDLIQRAMQLAGTMEAHEVAKIGDTPADIEEGRAAGCGLVVGVTYGTHSRAELERFGVPLIDRLPDLLQLVGAS
jgi:phosphonatase-like hydrolase